jgi:hypothetical protein
MKPFQKVVREWKKVAPLPNETAINEKSVRYTPRPIVEQVVDWMSEAIFSISPPKRILDPCAGRGVWAAAAKEVWPDAHVTAIEPRKEEEKALSQVADRVIVDLFRPEQLAREEKFDLILSNPPFELAQRFVELIYRFGLLRAPQVDANRPDNGGALCLLLPNDYGQRAVKTNAHIHVFPPAFQLRVPGPISFDDSGNAGPQSYSHFLWTAGHQFDHRICLDLPLLAPEFRRHPKKKGSN